MTLYLDVHRNQKDVTKEALAQAHLSDLEAQDKHGVSYLKYWFNTSAATICCLVDGPSKEACEAVHREAHGNLADQIIEVESGMVEDFLGGPEDEIGCALNNDGTLDTATRTILFTDMEGSTKLTQRLGDDEAMRMLRTHNAMIRGAISASSGREVKHTGDGLMASFVSVSRAVECAIGIQRAFAGYNDENPEEPIRVRIGLNAGEPVVENQDLFGASIQLARRTCDAAGSGCILVSNVVRELCIGKRFEFQDKGEHSLKGFDEPVKLHEVMWSSCA